MLGGVSIWDRVQTASVNMGETGLTRAKESNIQGKTSAPSRNLGPVGNWKRGTCLLTLHISVFRTHPRKGKYASVVKKTFV